jgi:methyl-accepting chemotaxis protein
MSSQELCTTIQSHSLGIEQTNRTIMRMDGVTQRNTALVEQSAAATEPLQRQAVELADVVGKLVLHQESAVRLPALSSSV